ncbi:hypothetical protein PMAYCL1PPCAC_20511, partial [Pristionchus mayeri]
DEHSLFYKDFRLVEGVIGGLKLTACLDTGAVANLIDKRRVDQMKGVRMKNVIADKLKDAQGKSIRTIGKVVLDVEMEVGKKCRVGFMVAEQDVPTILLGNSALAAMGMELKFKEENKESEDTSDNAVVLRTKYLAPGEVGTVIVSGGRRGEGQKVLITDREDVIEGINSDDAIVRVPVWNGSNVDRVYEKYDVIGRWSKIVVKGKVEKSTGKEDGSFQMNQCHLGNPGTQINNWMEIKGNLEKCRNGKLSRRIEEILRSRASVFAVGEDDLGRLKEMACDIRMEEGDGIGAMLSQKGADGLERPIAFFSRGIRDSEKNFTVVDAEALAVRTQDVRGDDEMRRRRSEGNAEDTNVKEWIEAQNKDDWVVSMREKLKGVKNGNVDPGEEVTIPSSTKKTSLADWVVHRGVLYLLGSDHERKLYIPEGRRDRFIQEIHDSPLSGHLCTKKLVQKLLNEVYWGSMLKDVQRVLRKCERCLLANSAKRMVPPLQPEIVQRFKIERKLTLPYHSRSNGLTERFNRTIEEIMRRIRMRDDQWEEALPYAVYAYNASPHNVTGETPLFLMHGRDDPLPVSAIPRENPAYTVYMDVDEYKRRMSWMIEKVRAIVTTRLENERRKMKERYDERHRNNMVTKPEVGDQVYIRVELKSGDIRKMAYQYEGPFRVVGTSATTVTVVRIVDGIDHGHDKDRRIVQWDRVRLVPKGEENED